MILYTFPLYQRLARALDPLGVPRGEFAVDRFTNGELHATVMTPPGGEDCVVLGGIAPPDEHLLATLLLAHTLKKDGARSVLALLPYLGYARHDKREAGRSLGTAWVGELFRASGIDELAAVDVHSSKIHQLFPVPVRSLSPAAVFAAEIRRLGLAGATVVAPDEGAVARCEAVREAAGLSPAIAWVEKTRTREGVTHRTMHGETGPRAIVVDDILDTGATLLSCCEALQRAGAREITVLVSHGLFTGTAWEGLWSRGVAGIACTDTVPLPERLAGDRRITVLSVAPLLAGVLTTRGRRDSTGREATA
jgi:ribose-phosphate pyrophosphokinase